MELRTGVSVETFGIFLFITTSPAECSVPSLLLWIPEVIFYVGSRHKDKAVNAFCLFPLL